MKPNAESCPPCGENAPIGAKGGPKSKKTLLAPPSPLQGTSSAREEVNGPLVRTHQHRSKNMRNLTRNLRKNQTPQERKLWWHLCRANLGFKFRRQYLIDDRYIADFVCLERKVIIEIDGSQHAENAQDLVRTAYLQEQGFQVLRFWNRKILQELPACLEVIRQACLNK